MTMSVILSSVDFDENRDMILPVLASGIMIIILLSIAWSMRLPRSSEHVRKTGPNKATNNSRISFVYGNLKIENELITREMVEKASETIDEENNEQRNR